jgi:hypothetical protein
MWQKTKVMHPYHILLSKEKKFIGDVANLIGKKISLIHLKPSPSTLGWDHNQRSQKSC